MIPTWNRAATLIAAIESVLAQTVMPLEILVCDDGSTDDSTARVTAIGDPRVRWLPGSRGGRPAIPRNRGIADASGDWLAFIDSDDTWEPRKLEHQLEALSRADARASCSDAWRLHADGSLGGRMGERPGASFFDLASLIDGNQIICSSAIVHRALFEIVEGFPEGRALKVGEDWALWLRVATLTSFVHVAEPLVFYRDDPDNSVRAGSADAWAQRIEVLKDFDAWCRRHRSKLPAATAETARQALRTARLGRIRNRWGQFRHDVRTRLASLLDTH